MLNGVEVVECCEDHGVEVDRVEGQRLYPCLFSLFEQYTSLEGEEGLFGDRRDWWDDASCK